MKNTFYAAILFSLLTACNSQPTETTATPETATPAATEQMQTTPADTTAKVDSTVAPAQ